jgi:MMP 1-O-methyltransferase
MKTIEAEVDAVDGWLNSEEGRLLYRLARRCKGRGVIVEIGSWKGKSTIWLSKGSLAGSGTCIHAIDPHTGSPEHSEMFGKVWTFEEFQRNISRAKVDQVVVPHVDFSTAVAQTFDKPVEFIFIDGLHEYEGVKDDFEAWYPKVIEGGRMAFHDTTCWPGVLKVMVDCVFKSQHFRKIRFLRSIVHAEKVSQNTALERAGNRVMMVLFLLHAWSERFIWRLVHNYLDSPPTRALVSYIKKKRHPAAVPAPVESGRVSVP